ncbi:MAG TPA: sugar ABC transporter substrate-binding protein, partial [Ktedonobacterales bacterium]|nr:sugar ABC transporter substrate-binding protein [Ktedonobacterales bacterium]
MRNWRHRASLCLALFLGVASVLSACSGGGASSGGVVQLTFWSFNQQITEQADLFNKSHPNIHVTALKQPSGPNQYYPKVLTAVKAGNAPDVALIEYQYIPTMVSNAALVDVSKYGANGVKDQFVDSAWAQVTQGGAVYGYPQDTGPMGFFYNSATFKKAGITHPPATWDEFAQDAVKIHALGPNYYITAFPPQSTGWFQGLMWQAGATWFSVDTAANAWKVSVNDATSKKVASYWQALVDKGLVSTVADFSNDWNAALNKGTIASWISAVWGQGVITGSAADTKGQWTAAPIPQWTAGAKTSAMWGGSAISVIAGTKHPQEANEFAQWYLTNSGSLSIGVKEIGWFPSNKTAQQSSDVNAP